MKWLVLIGMTVALAGCDHFSLSRLGYEALQQHECVQRTGVGCPEKSGDYDGYRAARQRSGHDERASP
jgi:hypothetical protein